MPDNGPIVAAIEDLPNGVLPLLDEQCWLGDRGKDSTFCTLLNQKNPICSAEFAKLDQKGRARFDPSNNFTLAHFVAPVTYTAQEFIEKNRDSIFEEMAHALVDSTNPLLPELFPASELDATEVRAAKGSGKSYGALPAPRIRRRVLVPCTPAGRPAATRPDRLLRRTAAPQAPWRPSLGRRSPICSPSSPRPTPASCAPSSRTWGSSPGRRTSG